MIKLSYTKKEYNNKEFVNLLVKRIKKQCKELGIHPGKEIIIQGSSRNVLVATELLKRAFKKPSIKSGKSEIKVLSIEEMGSEAFNKLQETESLPSIKNLFSKITEEDIKHLCKIFDIAYIKPEIHSLIEDLLLKHPDTAFSLSNTLQKQGN